MSNAIRSENIWLPTGNPATTNISSTDFEALGGQPGSLGQAYQHNDTKRYQRVRVDSGATSSTGNGLPAANDVLYWKDKSTYLVTNDVAQALGNTTINTHGYRNFVAGILRVSLTNAQVADRPVVDLQQGGTCSVASDGTGVQGDIAVAEDGTANRVEAVADGTAPTSQVVGTILGAAVANVQSVDLSIPSIP